jgi:hypothetical protein
MSAAERADPGEEGARAELRLLASLLIILSIVKIATGSLTYVAALVAAGGSDPDASRTIYWIPQVLFYTLLLTGARRLRGLEARARGGVLGLCVLSLVVRVLYNVADFTIGAGRELPALAIAMKLRLLAAGDVWDIIFPVLAIVMLLRPAVRRLFESR